MYVYTHNQVHYEQATFTTHLTEYLMNNNSTNNQWFNRNNASDCIVMFRMTLDIKPQAQWQSGLMR